MLHGGMHLYIAAQVTNNSDTEKAVSDTFGLCSAVWNLDPRSPSKS